MMYAWKLKAGTQGVHSEVTVSFVVVAETLLGAIDLVRRTLSDPEGRLTHIHISRVGPMDPVVASET